MRYKTLLCATGTTLAVLLAVLAIGTPLAAQELKPKHSRYKVIDVGTFGGPTSGYNFDSAIINGRGSVVGAADTPVFNEACGCFVAHAFRWKNGVLSDLGALPGGSDSVAAAINSKSSIVGLSTNGTIDPVTGPQWDAVLWKHGQMIDLGNLGGAFAVAIGINDRGQIVGGGANTIADPFGALFLPATTQSRALLWKDGTMQDLGTLGGNDAFAAFVNDRGQIAGNSLSDSVVNPTTQAPTMAPFFWENGRMINIGTLGGVFGTVSALNSRGQVTGSSNLAGDQTQHAFLWERGSLRDLGTLGGTFSGGGWIDEAGGVVGTATTDSNELLRAFRWKNGHMTDLGSLRGDPCSVGNSGNSKGQVVGNSLSDCFEDTHAFLWENGGPMVDLNSFLPPGSGILLLEGVFIGESGEIAVSGRLANGDVHAFVLVPDDDSSESAADVAQGSPAPDQLSPAASHAPVTPEKIAAFAARFTHRSRAFGLKPSK